MSKWYSIGFVGACVVFSALPIPYTAGFEAGGLPPCTVPTKSQFCDTTGASKCNQSYIACTGTSKNARSCNAGGGSVACQGGNNCAKTNHASRDENCK